MQYSHLMAFDIDFQEGDIGVHLLGQSGGAHLEGRERDGGVRTWHRQDAVELLSTADQGQPHVNCCRLSVGCLSGEWNSSSCDRRHMGLTGGVH